MRLLVSNATHLVSARKEFPNKFNQCSSSIADNFGKFSYVFDGALVIGFSLCVSMCECVYVIELKKHYGFMFVIHLWNVFIS